MDDVLRKQLSDDEQERYDLNDRRASLAGHFFVWPGIAGLISYINARPGSAFVCLAIVLVAFPAMVIFGGRARKIRELAEARFVGRADNADQPPPGPQL